MNDSPRWLLLTLLAALATGCVQSSTPTASSSGSPSPATSQPGTTVRPDSGTPSPVLQPAAGEALATFAGGCFWCMEAPFEELPGVSAVISGYTAGQVKNPTYKQVCAGSTGHAEAIQIHYDPSRISYGDLLEVFWRQIDPTDAGGQFVDRGTQYRSEIYFHDDAQRESAAASKKTLEASGRYSKPLVTPITPATIFYPAEEYHQDYYKKSTGHYKRYRRGSGRDRYLEGTWGVDRKYTPVARAPKHQTPQQTKRSYARPTEQEIRSRLTKLQFRVTQRDATEAPFANDFWDNKRTGIYVDIVTGEPLFSSRDKFKSGTGWPSFTRPIQSDVVKEATDHKLGYARREVRSATGDSHLGHVFKDGPAPTGLRYCINSASLRFIPKLEMAKEGYEELLETVE